MMQDRDLFFWQDAEYGYCADGGEALEPICPPLLPFKKITQGETLELARQFGNINEDGNDWYLVKHPYLDWSDAPVEIFNGDPLRPSVIEGQGGFMDYYKKPAPEVLESLYELFCEHGYWWTRKGDLAMVLLELNEREHRNYHSNRSLILEAERTGLVVACPPYPAASFVHPCVNVQVVLKGLRYGPVKWLPEQENLRARVDKMLREAGDGI